MERTGFNRTPGRKRMIMALLSVLFLLTRSNAQPAGDDAPTRWLIIFDTSADMKPRLPALRTELAQLLGTSMGSHMLTDDSVGVWTFDSKLRTGQFPLESWSPEDAEQISSEINKFLGKQHYSKNTQFSALQPLLNRVIQNSPRLTVLVFCDGEDNISGTPYDGGLNRIFQNRLAQQKQDKQPFVLVFRTQLGKYVGCSVNFPPGMLNFPSFPPYPEPAPPQPAQTNPTPPVGKPFLPPPPPKTPAPINIIGTNVMGQTPPQPSMVAETAATPTTIAVPPPKPPEAKQTGVVSAPPTNAVAPPQNKTPVAVASPKAEINPPPPAPPPQTAAAPPPVVHAAPPTNAPAQSTAAPPAQTNTTPAIGALTPAKQLVVTNLAANAAAPAKKSALGRQGLLAICGTLLLASIILIVLVYMNTRRQSRSSLISQSMRKR
jgi:hypothetical protein